MATAESIASTVTYAEKRATAEAVYWDLFRDAYGVRPRGIDTSNWTLQQFDEEFARLEQTIFENYKVQQAEELKAITEFENKIKEVLATDPNKTRESIINEFHERYNTCGDSQFLCYELGLPYGYFKNGQG